MSGYGELAAFYDAFTADVDYAAWAEYLLAAFARHGSRPQQLLDLACGSGSLLLELGQRGIDVIGVDGSPDMLLKAQAKAAGAGFSPLLLCQDMQALDLYGTVDGAVCLLDSLSHVLSTGGLQEILRRLGLFIAPGGLLIFDVNTPHKHAVTLGNNSFVFEQPGLVCVWRNAYLPARHETVMRLDFFQQEGDSYGRYTDEVRERAYSLGTWQRLLDAAGFTLLEMCGERSFTAPAADADRWVFIARNRATGQKAPA